MKRYPLSLISRKMQIKILRNYFILHGLANVSLTIPNAGEDVGKRNSHSAGKKIHQNGPVVCLVGHLGSTTLKLLRPHDPAVPLSDCLGGTLRYVHKGFYSRIFIGMISVEIV